METKHTHKKRWLSPSSINTYLRCPNRFFRRYILKQPTKLNIHLLRGSAVHKAIERFFREDYAAADSVYYGDIRRNLLDLFKDEWSNRKDQLTNLNLEPQDLTFYYYDSQKMLINFLHDFIGSEGSYDGQSEFEVSIFNKNWYLCGRIDRIIGNKTPPLLIDYKTCKSIDPANKDYRRQMGIYQILYEEKYGIKPKTAIHYLKFLDGLKEVIVSEAEIKDLKRTIQKVRHKTLSTDPDDYPCTCGGWCEKEFITTR